MSLYAKGKPLNGQRPHTQVQRESFPRWSATNRAPKRQPYRCQICNNPQIRSLASVYGRGVRTSIFRRGRLFKRGYSTSTSKSLLAEKCAPPEKRSYAFSILLLFSAAGIWFTPFVFNVDMLRQYLSQAGNIATFASLILGWAGLYLAARAWVWNSRKFPELLQTWQNSVLCEKCGTISEI